MDLILWRHSDAEDLAPEGDDLLRALTPKGERNARRMAEWLNRTLPATTRILCSPARRAVQTADALQRKYKIVEALRPDACAEELLAVARWPDAREPVLIVGHQPTLGLVAGYLMTGTHADGLGDVQLKPWSIRKAGVWWLRHRPREERGEVMLVTVRSPEMI